MKPVSVLMILSVSVALVGATTPTEAKDHKLQVQVTRPAAISLKGAKRLAVIATGGQCDQEIGNRLSARLFDSGVFELMERSQIEKIMKEHDLTMEGLADPTKAKEMGKLISVDAIVYGSIDRCAVTEKKGVTPLKKKNAEGPCVTVDAPITVREGSLNVTFKVTHIESGSQLAVRDFKEDFACSFVTDPYPDNGDCYSLFESNPKGANRNFLAENDIRNAMIDSVAIKFARTIAPYRETMTLVWEDEIGKEVTEQIINFLNAELIDDSAQLLDQRRAELEADVSLKPQDKQKKLIAAYYDSGILNEIKGDLTTAGDWYKKAFMLDAKDPDKKVKDAMKRIAELKRQQDALQAQQVGSN